MKLFAIFFCVTCLNAIAQEKTTVLVITNVESKIVLDGLEQGRANANAAFRIESSPGEHYLEAQALVNGSTQTKGEIIELEAGQQQIVKFSFDVPASTGQKELLVAEINFNIPGSLDIASWQSENPGMPYPYPSFYYAFEKGDEIVFDVSMTNAKGTNAIDVTTYPGNVIQYTNNAFAGLNGIVIKVPERSIYRFTLASNHIFPRNGLLRITRRPSSPETAAFNPNVTLTQIFTPVQVVEPQAFFVNSGSNADFKGGRSRVVIPVALPANTVEFFYRFSASRSINDIDIVKSDFGLFGELTKLFLNLSGAGAAMANIGSELLAQPPGADYCDIYLMTQENTTLFELKNTFQYYADGTRNNFKSGNVKVTCCREGTYYLGVLNPSYGFGVNVLIEVVAITATMEYVMDHK